jgi:hypothetical protein
MMSMKKFNDTIGNQTRDLPARSAVPQPAALLRAPPPSYLYRMNIKLLYNQPLGCLSLPSDSMESCDTVTRLENPNRYQPFILELYGLLNDSTSRRVIYDVFNSWQE